MLIIEVEFFVLLRVLSKVLGRLVIRTSAKYTLRGGVTVFIKTRTKRV